MATSKIVLITGANTGIGFETVKTLLRSDKLYHILLAGRNFAKAQQAARTSTEDIESRSTVEPIQLDIESDESITQAFDQVSAKHPRIDCLVNNAGAAFDASIQDGSMTPRQAWNKTWDVNVTGAHVTTLTFLPLLLKSQDPRLLFITSGLSTLEGASSKDNPRYTVPPAGLPKQFGFTSYRSSKTGLNMMMVEWTRVLANAGVKVWAISPGLLATGLGGRPDLLKQMGAGEPSIGGTVICGVIEGKRDADVGKVVREYGTPVQPW